MTWQDWIIGGVNLWFLWALIPTIRDPNNKPPIATSLPMGIGCLILSGTLWTMDQRFAPIVIGVLGLAWLLITYQMFVIRKK
ncbi:MAG: hypothetical protein AAB798_01895 [Patescibacteria group bacterium]